MSNQLNSNASTTPIELRQNKTSIGYMLGLLSFVAIGVFCYLFLFHTFSFTPFKIILLLATCMLVLIVLRTIAQLRRNKPLIVFFDLGVEINETAQPVVVLWQDVLSWDVRKQDATHYLILTTTNKRHSINISWLEATPVAVEDLMKTFMQPLADKGK